MYISTNCCDPAFTRCDWFYVGAGTIFRLGSKNRRKTI